MSCRRSDRAKFVGCRIGDVAMRGCSRGCCPYSDSEISQNTRPHLLTNHFPPEHQPPSEQPEGRRGLYYRQCMSTYRPKFICAEPSCRRSIKPVYDPDRFEYEISEFQDWSVRPLKIQSPELQAAYRNFNRINSNGSKGNEEVAEFKRLQRKDWDEPTSLSTEEFEFLKARNPLFWWNTVVSTPRMAGTSTINMVRCPGCGKSTTRVGSNLRIPKKTDEKAWREIVAMIGRGEDMVAKFSYCATVEEHEKMVNKVLDLRSEEESKAT